MPENEVSSVAEGVIHHLTESQLKEYVVRNVEYLQNRDTKILLENIVFYAAGTIVFGFLLGAIKINIGRKDKVAV